MKAIGLIRDEVSHTVHYLLFIQEVNRRLLESIELEDFINERKWQE